MISFFFVCVYSDICFSRLIIYKKKPNKIIVFPDRKREMTSIFVRQLWSSIGSSSFLRPTIQFQPSTRTKMVRRINRNRVPTHTKPSDQWVQKKSV